LIVSMQSNIPYLSAPDLEGLNISIQDVLRQLEKTLVEARQGRIWSTPKSIITPPDGRYIMATIAVTDDPPLAVTKSLVLNTENAKQGLPQINSLITVLDGQTGVPLATLDGNWITAVRTAGLSGLAAKYMANPDSASIAFLGCGVQAQSHLAAFAKLFPIERIFLFGRGQKNIEKLVEAASNMGLEAEQCDTAQQAIENAEIVISSVSHTSVEKPFLDASWLREGAFASITDLAVPWHKGGFAMLDKVAVDDLEQEAASPQKLASSEDVDGDLAGLVSRAWAGRDHEAQRTAFVFRGHALGDLAMASIAYEAAANSSLILGQ